jgi:hypothetical protein
MKHIKGEKTMFLRKNKSTNDKVNFKVISQDHAKPDDINFGVKIISRGRNKNCSY